mmetsp:Transcript_5909/g.22469  ORF Transcript_5909/g.22469 Transcript_5909/m.22469 type:complete len:366 (+) Transcript_5909:441-1538(+)
MRIPLRPLARAAQLEAPSDDGAAHTAATAAAAGRLLQEGRALELLFQLALIVPKNLVVRRAGHRYAHPRRRRRARRRRRHATAERRRRRGRCGRELATEVVERPPLAVGVRLTARDPGSRRHPLTLAEPHGAEHRRRRRPPRRQSRLHRGAAAVVVGVVDGGDGDGEVAASAEARGEGLRAARGGGPNLDWPHLQGPRARGLGQRSPPQAPIQGITKAVGRGAEPRAKRPHALCTPRRCHQSGDDHGARREPELDVRRAEALLRAVLAQRRQHRRLEAAPSRGVARERGVLEAVDDEAEAQGALGVLRRLLRPHLRPAQPPIAVAVAVAVAGGGIAEGAGARGGKRTAGEGREMRLLNDRYQTLA